MKSRLDSRIQILDSLNFEPELVITCLKRRFTGVSGTVNSLLPLLANDLQVAYLGADLPGVEIAALAQPHRFQRIGLWQGIWIRSRNRKIVWHVRRNHELLLAILLRDVLRRPIRVLFTSAAIRRHSLLPRFLIARADAVIGTTDRASALVPHVEATIGHGVDTDLFHPAADREKSWREVGLPRRYGILISGRVRREKGTHVFLEAMLDLLKRYPDWTAVLAGLCKHEDEKFLQPLRQSIERAGLRDRVVFLGPVDPAEMPVWYSRCLVTVACPLYEGYGLTVIEAMASGCAVVASRTGAFESMVEEGRTGSLVLPGDVQGLVSALEPLLADPQHAHVMGEAGRIRAVERFSITAESRGIAEVVRTLLRKGP